MGMRSLLAALVALPMLSACASPPSALEEIPADAPALADIHRCLLASRQHGADAITSGMVEPIRYNDCMRARGWRGKTAPVSTRPRDPAPIRVGRAAQSE